MAIFRSCICGHVLREDSGRLSHCPACGIALSIASGGLPHAEPPAPPQSLRPLEVPAPPCEPGPPRRPPPEPYRPPRERGLDFRVPPWRLEENWASLLAYPLGALWRVTAIAFVGATLVLMLTLAWPARSSPAVAVQAPFSFAMLGLLLVLFSYTMAFLAATYTAGRHGKAGFVAWPGLDFLAVYRGGLHGLLAFAAGPALPLFVGFVFWARSGELQWIDWLILGELGIVSIGYWVLALLAVEQSRNLGDLNPVMVVRTAREHGFRAPLAAFLIALPAAGLLLRWVDRLDQSSDLTSWPLFFIGGTLLLSWCVLLLRWLGVNRFRAVRATAAAQLAADEQA